MENKNIFTIENFCQAQLDYHKDLRKEGKHLTEKGETTYFQYWSIVVESKNATAQSLAKIYRYFVNSDTMAHNPNFESISCYLFT